MTDMRRWVLVVTLALLVVGVALLVYPSWVVDQLDVPAGPGGEAIAQLLGAMIGVFVLYRLHFDEKLLDLMLLRLGNTIFLGIAALFVFLNSTQEELFNFIGVVVAIALALVALLGNLRYLLQPEDDPLSG